jgi:predicted secreted protein
MNARLWLLSAILAIAASLVLPAAPASADGPGGPHGHGFMGDPPVGGGLGILLMTQERTREQLILELHERQCVVASVALMGPGRWIVYHPGAPAFVNAAFPPHIRAHTPLFVRCAAQAGPALALGTEHNGTAVTLTAGQLLQVALPSNPTTGFGWRAQPAPAASVLVQLGPARFVPDSDLLGAPGTETLGFLAVAAGSTVLRLEYVRPFEPGAVADTWSVTVTVAPRPN